MKALVELFVTEIDPLVVLVKLVVIVFIDVVVLGEVYDVSSEKLSSEVDVVNI
jgi:hypothetical protein